MAKLSKREQEILEKLQAKSEAPDRPTPNLNVTLDLGDDKQVAYAKRMGWLDDDEEETEESEESPEEDTDEKPKRKGYFD